MLQKLMDNPYAWAILSLISIISFAYAIITQHKNKEKKQFSYTQNSYLLIKSKKSDFDKLSVLYGGQQVESLCISKFTIWNSGNRIINSNDMVRSKELTIKVNDENQILDADIITVSEKTNNFNVEIIDEKTAKILFDYVDKKDGAVIQIIHTGLEASVSIDCKIKGGLSIKSGINDTAPRLIGKLLNSDKFTKFSAIALGVTMVLVFIVAVICTVAIFDISLQKMLFSQEATEPVVAKNASIVASIVSWTYVLLFVIVYYPSVKRIYGMGVPKSLKKNKNHN